MDAKRNIPTNTQSSKEKTGCGRLDMFLIWIAFDMKVIVFGKIKVKDNINMFSNAMP